MHLDIAAILLLRRTGEAGIRQDALHLGAAEKVVPQGTSAVDVRAGVARIDGAFDRRGLAGVQNLADDAGRARTNAGDARQGRIGTTGLLCRIVLSEPAWR